MLVVIAGAQGAVARHLTRQLVDEGHDVRGLIRNPDHAADLEDAGAEAVVCDLEELDHDALAEQVRRLRDAGVSSRIGTCPDLGTVRPIPQPLRQVARTWSRRLAAAQAIAVVEAGGRAVSVGSILGPEFDASPALLFGPDRFHPSAAGYAALASVLAPSTLAALGFAPPDEEVPEARRGEGVLSIGRAAVQAAKVPGTELDATEVNGAARGIGGRWVTLMRRRRPARLDVETPDPDEVSSESGVEVS